MAEQPFPFVTRNFSTIADIDLNYKLGAIIGSGSFAKVRKAEHRLTSVPVAIKIISRKNIRESNMLDKVIREVNIMKLLTNHPHVIRLYEVMETHEHIYMIMEYAERGELYEYLFEKGRFYEDEARWYFQQLIAGLDYCHRNGVVHRDLKFENLLLDSQLHLKIADFGLSNTVRAGQFLRTSCGSTNYAAPEVIVGRAYEGTEVDVWSCGVILYALLCGSLPFDDENVAVLFNKIKYGRYVLPTHISPGPRDLITRMLQVDPARRIKLPEIAQHPWFQMNMPPHLVTLPYHCSHIDEEIVRRVAERGIDVPQLRQALTSGETTRASVTYFIMLLSSRPVSNGYQR